MSFVLGILLCCAALVIIVMDGGSPAKLLDCNALLLIAAGMAGVMFIICPLTVLRQNLSAAAKALHKKVNTQKLIEQIIELVGTARREGILALEGCEDNVREAILKKGLILISNSADRETIENILQSDAKGMCEKEKSAQEFIERIAVMLPGIGMIGTLVEIVQMLYTYKGPQNLAPGIAKALIPVIYGGAAAYLILMPLASRIKSGSDRLKRQRELEIQGVLAIQAGEPPHIAEERLSIYLDTDHK